MTEAKVWERNEARRLRKEGVSVRTIAQILGVSRGSVSIWVRDIELTPDQKKVLRRNQTSNQETASRANVEKHKQLRIEAQEEGRVKAREGDLLHMAGCMLYWAEGTKIRNKLVMVNSDVDMMIFFMRFLRDAMNVENTDIRVMINCYLGNGLTLEEIEAYWLNALQLPKACLRKAAVNKQPSSSQQKGRKLPYGVCHLGVAKSTYLVMHVYGAIQEYIGIEKPEWLM